MEFYSWVMTMQIMENVTTDSIQCARVSDVHVFSPINQKHTIVWGTQYIVLGNTVQLKLVIKEERRGGKINLKTVSLQSEHVAIQDLDSNPFSVY